MSELSHETYWWVMRVLVPAVCLIPCTLGFLLWTRTRKGKPPLDLSLPVRLVGSVTMLVIAATLATYFYLDATDPGLPDPDLTSAERWGFGKTRETLLWAGCPIGTVFAGYVVFRFWSD